MISLYPRETETHVLPFDKGEVFHRIEGILDQPFEYEGLLKVVQGRVGQDSFQINIRTRRHEFFMPLIQGTMESTSKGSIVFVTYSLFAVTRALLTFWTLLLPLLAFPWYFESGNPWTFAILTGAAVVIHLVARANFRLHQKTASKILNQLLT